MTTVVRGCTRNSERCPEGKNLRQLTPECCKAKVTELLTWISEQFAREGITWWADYGTLLGAVKCGGQYPKDKDGDIGVLQSDLPKVRALEAIARRAGYDWVLKGPRQSGPFGGGNSIKLRYSAKNHINVDMFFWHPHDSGTCRQPYCQDRRRRVPQDRQLGRAWHRFAYISVDQYKGKEVPDAQLFPLTSVSYAGLTLPAPAGILKPGPTTPNWFLEHRYGPQWEQDRDANHDGKRR